MLGLALASRLTLGGRPSSVCVSPGLPRPRPLPQRLRAPSRPLVSTSCSPAPEVGCPLLHGRPRPRPLSQHVPGFRHSGRSPDSTADFGSTRRCPLSRPSPCLSASGSQPSLSATSSPSLTMVRVPVSRLTSQNEDYDDPWLNRHQVPPELHHLTAAFGILPANQPRPPFRVQLSLGLISILGSRQ